MSKAMEILFFKLHIGIWKKKIPKHPLCVNPDLQGLNSPWVKKVKLHLLALANYNIIKFIQPAQGKKIARKMSPAKMSHLY